MVLVPGGTYTIGDESPRSRSDAPRVRVTIRPFYMDRYAVTNAEFEAFVEATGYKTSAEEAGGGWVYEAGHKDWTFKKGANWRQPLGPGSSIADAKDHPVVLVSWEDASAYAAWVGKRLPTEAEWEVAARSARSVGDYPLDDPTDTSKVPSANVWQGHWPDNNELTDGYFYTAPVTAFQPNSLGLYNMIGNTWEWTGDWYTNDNAYREAHRDNPIGPPTGEKRVARGGSWFCSPNYCSAYRPGFRGKSPPKHAFNNVGFRCAADEG